MLWITSKHRRRPRPVPRGFPLHGHRGPVTVLKWSVALSASNLSYRLEAATLNLLRNEHSGSALEVTNP